MAALPFFCFILSLARLPAVAVAAEHLAVLLDRATAFAPRRDVVTLHLFQFEVVATERTDTLLTLIDGEFDVVGKSAKSQPVLVAREHVRADAALRLHLRVDDEA